MPQGVTGTGQAPAQAALRAACPAPRCARGQRWGPPQACRGRRLLPPAHPRPGGGAAAGALTSCMARVRWSELIWSRSCGERRGVSAGLGLGNPRPPAPHPFPAAPDAPWTS